MTNQIHKSIDRVLTIALLCAIAPRMQDHDPILRDTLTRKPRQTLTHIFWKRRRTCDIESKLDSRGCLVDMLPSRSRSAHEIQFDLIFVDGDFRRDRDHGSSIPQDSLNLKH
jgi:hypothetical protein